MVINHFVISGSWCEGMTTGWPVSSFRMASLSSAESSKSKIFMFSAMRSFLPETLRNPKSASQRHSIT